MITERTCSDREQAAYDAGYDYGKTVAGPTNFHFGHFATTGLTAAWASGRADAMIAGRKASKP